MARKKNVRSRKTRKAEVSPSTPKSSRKQRYRAKQRNSWIAFLGKLLLFFVPAALATWFLIDLVLRTGEELDLLVLDLRKAHKVEPTELKRSRVWNCKTYGTSSDGAPQLPAEIQFGGPGRNSLVIFNDLLGSAREINNGPAKACFFIPANAEEHQTHALAGIPDAETSQHQQQWQPVDQYVNGTLNQLAQQKSSQTSTPKKVLFVFDVDHPDLAGRLPPQANAFIEL